MFEIGDLVEIKTNAAIPAFAGSTGIITRHLGRDLTQVATGQNEYDGFYYEVDIASQGSQILLEHELTLLRKA